MKKIILIGAIVLLLFASSSEAWMDGGWEGICGVLSNLTCSIIPAVDKSFDIGSIIKKINDLYLNRLKTSDATGHLATISYGLGLVITDATGELATVNRGVADSDITYWRMRNSDGEICYIYPHADQNAIVVSGSKP